MTSINFRNSFFAFLGVVLFAVLAALLLNMPPESSRAANAQSAGISDDYVADLAEPKVVDARIEYDAPVATVTN